MNVTRAIREFSFMGVKLPDPNASLPPEEVKAAYVRIWWVVSPVCKSQRRKGVCMWRRLKQSLCLV